MPRNPLVGIVMATLLEATPFLDALSLQKTEDEPFEVFQHGDAVLVISGIGKANAAMATAYCCLRFSPEWICNVGAAGATGSGHPLGAIYHIDKVTEWDRPLLGSGAPHVHIPDTLEGFETAAIVTQDVPVLDPDLREQLSGCADLIDMEAAAVVQAARKFRTRCVLFKWVTDTPEHSGHGDIVKYIELYREPFCRFFSNSVMPVLAGARSSD